MHAIPDMLELSLNQLLLFALDIVLLLSIVRDNKLMDIFDEFFHHAGFQGLKAVRQKVVA